MTAHPLLDEWISSGARLLSAERIPLRGSLDAERALRLVLTFDCGRLRLESGDEGDALTIDPSAEGEAPVAGLLSADEDEPWWALLGHALCAAAIDLDDAGRATRLRLQFRPHGENPHFVRVAARDGQLRVTPAGEL